MGVRPIWQHTFLFRSVKKGGCFYIEREKFVEADEEKEKIQCQPFTCFRLTTFLDYVIT